jgi:small-conductance mechanosensitive channel
MQILEQVYVGNSVLQWGAALGVALATLVTFQVVKSIVVRQLHKLAERTDSDFDDFIIKLLGSTKFLLVLVLSLYAGSFMLELEGGVRSYLSAIAVIASLLQGALWGNRLIDYAMLRFTQERMDDDPASTTAAGIIGTVARIIFFSLIVLVGLASVGFDIDALVAGLGIGGIAVALAVNGILQDLFGSLTIALDKPFAVGDFINVGEFSGTVEHVGMKSTRVRSITGEQLVMSNGDLLSSRLRNYGQMQERRGNLKLGVTYDTTADQLEAIPGIIQEIIDEQELVRFDRSHFSSYGDSSLNVETVYWVETPVYLDFMNATQAINLKIKRRFEQEGIEFAYPTQTIFVEKPDGGTD